MQDLRERAFPAEEAGAKARTDLYFQGQWKVMGGVLGKRQTCSDFVSKDCAGAG